jgi:hypothetical protein
MSDIVGTWRLISTQAHGEDGKPLPPPYGPKARGVAVFQPDGRMMAVLCDTRPNIPDGERDYNSYCGNYTFDGRTLVTKVDAASDPNRMGSEQVRHARFEGARLILNPPPRSWRGSVQHHELVWERIA